MKARAAVFLGPNKSMEIREYSLPSIEPEGMIVKVRMSTICGSDLHTWQGRREAPLPIILGHEITGEIADKGKGFKRDPFGKRLRIGDRITWTIMASCGKCFYCQMKSLPQKCTNLFKYGHASCANPPHLNGGLAEYVYIRPGTNVFKIPNELADEEVTPINCALSTMVNGLEVIGVQPGDNAVIQGAGLLGIITVALLKERSAAKIIVLDKVDQRLKIAKKFGADFTLNINDKKPNEIIERIKDLTAGRGVDLVIEVAGVPTAIPQGIRMLGIGGKYLIAGTVFPEANFTLDGYSITSKILTIKGIHNYETCHLGQALDFLAKVHTKYPFKKLVSKHFDLVNVTEAFQVAAQRQAIRVAITP